MYLEEKLEQFLTNFEKQQIPVLGGTAFNDFFLDYEIWLDKGDTET